MKTFTDMYAESATTATFTVGFSNVSGKLVVSSPYTNSQGGTSSFGSFFYDGVSCTLTIGDVVLGKPGKFILGRSGATSQSILLDAATATVVVGDKNSGNGNLKIRNRIGNETIIMNGETATLTLGTAATTTNSEPANDGDLIVKNKEGVQTAQLDGASATLTLGGGTVGGDIVMKDAGGNNTIVMNGVTGNLTLGGGTADGDIIMKDAAGNTAISCSGSSASLTLGSTTTDGDLYIKNMAGNNTIMMDGGNATLTVGGIGANGDILVKNSSDINTIKITGSNGDIEFLNADFAEEFDIAPDELDDALPGTVMCLGANGALAPSGRAYCSRVAGIIAGAGSYRPGIVMDKKGGAHRRAVAMVGKVYCRVDATEQPVCEGDMLTTSHRKGFAMKATNRNLAFGATIGKALGRLDSGTGLIPVLVTLQ